MIAREDYDIIFDWEILKLSITSVYVFKCFMSLKHKLMSVIHSKHNKLLFISSFNCCCWLQSSSKWITDIFDRSYKDNLNIILVCLSCHLKVISLNILSPYILSTLCIFLYVYFLHMKYENHFHRMIYISYIQLQYNGYIRFGWILDNFLSIFDPWSGYE